MKNRIGRKLLTATLFVVSLTSIAGCYYDRGYDRDYAYRDRIVTVITGVGKT
jgi:hypothetical protein